MTDIFGQGSRAWAAMGVTLLTLPIWLEELRLLEAAFRKRRRR
jgi:hypothetical protein